MTEQILDLPERFIDVFEGSAAEEEGGLNIRAAWGGRGSGKTRTFALMTAVKGYIWAKAGIKGIIMCAREVFNDIKDSSFAEVAAAIEETPWLKAFYKVGKASIETKCGRIKYVFSGLSARVIRGVKSTARLLLVWVDEAEPISETVWRTVIPTLRDDRAAELWVTWNPEEERAPTNQRFMIDPPPGAKVIEMNWRDNPWFPRVLDVMRRGDKKRFPDTYEHVWEGGFLEITEGAYFNMQMRAAKLEGRICGIPIERHLPVFTFWDLGLADNMAIWFLQVYGKELRMINYYQNSGEALGHYIDYCEDLQKEHKFEYAKHFGPHDIEVRELTTGKSRKDWAADERQFVFETVPRMAGKQDGIDAARRILPRVWFDKKRCEDGTEAVKGYRRTFNKETNAFSKTPLHNWASDGADAFQQFAIAWDDKFAILKSAVDTAKELASSRGNSGGGTQSGGWMG